MARLALPESNGGIRVIVRRCGVTIDTFNLDGRHRGIDIADDLIASDEVEVVAEIIDSGGKPDGAEVMLKRDNLPRPEPVIEKPKPKPKPQPDFHDERLGGHAARLSFRFLRTCIVSGSERPSSLPFCHYVRWEKLPNYSSRMRVFYLRTDLKHDGNRLRLSRRRTRPDESIVCAKRLQPLPPKRWQYRPTRDQMRSGRKLLKAWQESWTRWAAEYQPTTTWRTRWSRWWGPTRHARAIILASEVAARPDLPVRWFDNSPFYLLAYCRVMWWYPRTPNQIRVDDLAEHGLEVIGFISIDPHAQRELSQYTQRILVLDHRDGDKDHVFGIHLLASYKDCATPESLYPGTIAEPFDESQFKIIDPQALATLQARKRNFQKEHQL